MKQSKMLIACLLSVFIIVLLIAMQHNFERNINKSLFNYVTKVDGLPASKIKSTELKFNQSDNEYSYNVYTTSDDDKYLIYDYILGDDSYKFYFTAVSLADSDVSANKYENHAKHPIFSSTNK